MKPTSSIEDRVREIIYECGGIRDKNNITEDEFIMLNGITTLIEAEKRKYLEDFVKTFHAYDDWAEDLKKQVEAFNLSQQKKGQDE